MGCWLKYTYFMKIGQPTLSEGKSQRSGLFVTTMNPFSNMLIGGLRSNLDKSDNFVIILDGKVMMNDRQTFFLLRGALSCYIEQTI